MSVDEVAVRTGLSPSEAELAMQRHYDEPFVVESDGCSLEVLTQAITARNLRWAKGDRFHHLMGAQDKGQAVHYLIDCSSTATAVRLPILRIGSSRWE